jgi:hypothetical protein
MNVEQAYQYFLQQNGVTPDEALTMTEMYATLMQLDLDELVTLTHNLADEIDDNELHDLADKYTVKE